MTLADIKNHIFRATKTNATSFPAADMVIALNNARHRAESIIRATTHNFSVTDWVANDLSTGTASPWFHSDYHELIPLWIELDYAGENVLNSKNPKAQKVALIEDAMKRWYGLRKYRVATVTIASPGVFTLDNHFFATNDRVILETTGALPTGLSAETWYYAIYVTDHTFKLSSTRDGSAINTSGTQSGTHFIGRERQGRFRKSWDSNDSNK